jgi:hypothetical protein
VTSSGVEGSTPSGWPTFGKKYGSNPFLEIGSLPAMGPGPDSPERRAPSWFTSWQGSCAHSASAAINLAAIEG